MCGLGAIIELRDGTPSSAALTRMSQALAHRGPDDDGFFVHKNVGMVFRRLSILDVTQLGHQPMHDASGRYTITFNGEIYNYVELRHELEGLGHTFASTSDTEVLLAAFTQWQERCLQKLNGMWAFVILDKVTGECFCARDRFGIKPLYFYQTCQRIVIASEARAIKCSGLYAGAPDRSTIGEYLYYGELDTSERTFYEQIQSVPPAGYMRITRDGVITRKSYWQPPTTEDPSIRDDDLLALLHDSVRIRLRSDVPVGVFLSGGLDSTSILCLATEILGTETQINAYSYMPEEFGERKYIESTIGQTNAKLVGIHIDEFDLWNELLRMTKYQDAPVHTPSALVGYCLYKVARNDGMKVILNGQGADETFAGYGTYFRNYWYSLLTGLHAGKLIKQLQAYGAYHHLSRFSLQTQLITLFAKVQLNRISFYRRQATRHHRNSLARDRFVSAELTSSMLRSTPAFEDASLENALRKSVSKSPLPLYLRIEDRNSMAHSVESRVPFMDYRLVELALKVPAGDKLDGYWNKVRLRDMLKGQIPESVRTRPDKMGFATPDARWIRHWASNIETIFQSHEFAQRGLFNASNLITALKQHCAGAADYNRQIFKALEVELWMRAYDGQA